MKAVLAQYRKIEKHIIYLILAELFIQLTNASFFLLLNYYMLDEGYQDFAIAKFVKVRFFAVMLLAFPLGLYLKGLPLRPVFITGVIMVPFMALATIFSIQSHNSTLLFISMSLWGASFALVQVTALPYILLNAKPETHSESIALFFQTWSVGTVIVGFIAYFLGTYYGSMFSEKNILILFAFIGFIGAYFVLKVKKEEVVGKNVRILDAWSSYDWSLIARVTIPTAIIAIGAGFTIPFINLFFKTVHGIESDTFSLMGACTYLLVAVGVFFIPAIKRSWGYEIAITLIQSLSVLALIIMATTEWYQTAVYATYVAIFFYIVRQPLMNVAGPMTSELSMYYVGEKNRELVSALNASIWSGSWAISAYLFEILRKQEMKYSYIFLITATLYIFGVLWYYFLIKDFHKRKKKGII